MLSLKKLLLKFGFIHRKDAAALIHAKRMGFKAATHSSAGSGYPASYIQGRMDGYQKAEQALLNVEVLPKGGR